MASERPAMARPSLSQQILRSFRPRGAVTLAASSATASASSEPLDHSFAPAETSLPPLVNPQVNPFDLEPAAPPVDHVKPSQPQTPAEEFKSHLVELLKPLPLAEPTRGEAIADRCSKLNWITNATLTLDPPPSQAQVFRLAIAIVGSSDDDQYPMAVREAACNLLCEAIKVSDDRAASAAKVVTETRSGAPGSQSSTSLDSDQPLANIDRALLYRLVVSMLHEGALTPENSLIPTREDLSLTSLPLLHVKLKTLHVLTKDGKVIVSFQGLVPLLSQWLRATWRELQALRQLARLVNTSHISPQQQQTHAGGHSGPSSQPLDQTLYVEQVSHREWSLRAIQHLLTSIMKFNFAKADQIHVEEALKSLAGLILDPLDPAIVVRGYGHHPDQVQVSGGPSLTRVASVRKSARATSDSDSRSRSGDRKVGRSALTEGYSYYGTEPMTPDSGVSRNTSPLGTPQMSPRQGGAVAPMQLSTLAPLSASAMMKHPSRLSHQMDVDEDGSESGADDEGQEERAVVVYPELQDVEVQSSLLLLDTVITYGYLAPSCVADISKLLCRILGYEHAAVSASASRTEIDSLSALQSSWQNAALGVLSKLLRSHSANTAIKIVRNLLADPAGEKPSSEGGGLEQSTRPQPLASMADEDQLVVLGAVLFLKSALIVTARAAAEGGSGASGPSGGTASQSAGGSSVESALTPRLTLPLMLPALRGALARHSDIVDLQVISLIEDVLVPPSDDTVGGRLPLLPGGAISLDEWNAILQLTTIDRRHMKAWHFALANSEKNNVPVPIVLQALVDLLAKLPLAKTEQLAPSTSASDGGSEKGAAPLALPWTPRLAMLLLSLAPALPSKLTMEIIDYHRHHYLCTPGNPDWIANLQKLLQSFHFGRKISTPLSTSSENGSVPQKSGLSSSAIDWQSKSKHALMTLLVDHVYDSVVSFPLHRALLLREVILPGARMLLPHEKDSEVEDKIRKVLVHAACLSSAASEEAEGPGEGIFTSVRTLLCKLARAPERDGDISSAPASHPAHVHFADLKGSHEHRATSATAHKTVSTAAVDNEKEVHPAKSSVGDDNMAPPQLPVRLPTRPLRSVFNLISIFNQIAFASPWVDFEDVAGLLNVQERKARDGCIAIFRDLVSLILPTEDSSRATQDDQVLSSPASPGTKLTILQWFLHIRTDDRHRVYLVRDLDDLIAPLAAILLKTPESKAVAAAAESAEKANDKARSSRAEGREGGRRMANDMSAATRSMSKIRDSSRERGRGAERIATDAPQRKDRSVSASRALAGAASGANAAPKKETFEHEDLWQIPQSISFEWPTTSLRSDIVYTYIHANPTSNAEKPLPLPVSELLAAYIKIISSETDWELCSYLICHLPAQLANKHLFCGPKAQAQILILRQHLCSMILQQKLMANVALPEEIKRSDIYAVMYDTLTVLLSYRALFSRSQQDEMVETFIAGLSKSQVTAQPCVRALSVALFESQKSVTRLLPSMLVKLSTIMSSMTMSVHILELIAMIGQIPACYANFTEAEHRRVFGISLQYIQYHQSPAAAMREDFRSTPATFTLSQYVVLLAYYNISLWFMSLRLSERAKHVQAITRGLLLANEGREKMSEQSEVCFDFLARATHSNLDPKPMRSFMNSVIMGPSAVSRSSATRDPNRPSKTWLIGRALITITALRKEGWVELLARRASGTMAMICKVENAPVSVLPAEDDERTDLLAVMMMDRDPSLAQQESVLRAPRLYDHHKMTPQLGAQGVISAGDRLRAQVPRAISSSGARLGERARSSSMSEVLESNGRSLAEGPYSSVNAQKSSAVNGDTDGLTNTNGDGLTDGLTRAAAANESLNARVGDAIVTQVMDDILKEGEKIQQNEHGASPEVSQSRDKGAHQLSEKYVSPPVKRSVERDAALDPSTIALALSSYPDYVGSTPILLPDDAATERYLRSLDLTPVVDLHKIGCLYVGPNQKNEVEILGNRNGSPAYTRFLSGLGDLITLKGQKDVYTGGLDTEMDLDGKYAYAWSDDIVQVVFHAATMMPNRQHDERFNAKKALIGNDWVHIVFNESGDEYRFETIASQFNCVNIVISPTTKGGTALGSVSPIDTIFYRVSLQRRAGLPSFSPVGDGQLISAEALPMFVRCLALNANVLSQIASQIGDSMQPFSSNWCNRLRLITRHRDRIIEQRKAEKEKERKRLEAERGGAAAGVDLDMLMGGEGPDSVDSRDFTAYT